MVPRAPNAVSETSRPTMKQVLALLGLALLVAVALGVSTKEFKERIGPVANQCKNNVSATDDDVKNLINRNKLETRTAKCLQHCVYNKVGVMSGNTLNGRDQLVAVFKKVYEGNEEKQKLGESIVDKCLKQFAGTKETDGCEIASMVQHCVTTNLK